MSRRQNKRRVMAEMNVVPYIDVMLVLLVIFMVTAPMMQTGVQIDLPDANASALPSDSSKGPIYIAINPQGEITLEDGINISTNISNDELTQQLSAQLSEQSGDKNNRPVYIRADSNIAYKTIMQVMVAAQKAGAKKIGLMAEAELNNN